MPVAETASTFNENIIMNAAIDEAEGETKLALIETQLQDLTQIMCDIYSRFLFEKKVFEKRKEGFLFPDELEAMMLDAQKQAYGDGLDEQYLHPYMWINKSHYYSSALSFYNFPYAFGGLFARGLIVKYHEMKDAFVPKYRELLHATTVSDVEDLSLIHIYISMDATSYLGICIRIGNFQGIVFLHRKALWFAAALSAMYPITEPGVTYDFLLLFGLQSHRKQRSYYYDQTNALYIGMVSGGDEMLHFLYLKEMILTLYNALCIQKHDLPIHASMVHIAYSQQQQNLVFAGMTHSGKSELLDAILKSCHTRKIAASAYYDDSGILHYLDNAIVSTGSEVSACKDISYVKKQQLFAHYASGIFLKEEDTIRYQITPLTTYESSLQFYPVHALFYLNAKAKFQGWRKVESLDDAIALFLGHHDKEDFFCQTLAAYDHQVKSQELIHEFLTILYTQNVGIYELSTKGTPYQKQFLFERLANAILDEILDGK